MSTPAASSFSGTIPEKYDRCLGPMFFLPYAKDVASRLTVKPGSRILEVAAGTGLVTQEVQASAGPEVTIVASDLQEPMLEIARKRHGESIELHVADACALQFQDADFDVVICQFGVMFFPDKLEAMREAFRVLKPGGKFIFNVWDSIDHNDFTRTAVEAITGLFGPDAAGFYKVPFGYYDRELIRAQLSEAGFVEISDETVTLPCISATADMAAEGLVEGTPLSIGLDAISPTAIAESRAAARQSIAERFGDSPAQGSMRAIVFEATKP